MSLKPLKDRVVAKKEQPLEKTKSGILLGDAKEKPAYAVVESVGPEVKSVKAGTKSSAKIIPPPKSNSTTPNISSLKRKISSPLYK